MSSSPRQPTATPPSGEPLRILGLGAGGHAKVVLDLLQCEGRYQVAGLLDADPARAGAQVLGVPVLGGNERLAGAAAEGCTGFFVGVGATGSTALRRKLFQAGLEAGLEPVPCLHPRSVLAASARWGRGFTAMAGAVVNAEAQVGDNVVVNTAAVIEHDCQVGDHVFIAPGALVMGGCRVGAGAYLGAGCVLRQGVSIGEEAVVGAGAVVIRDVPAGMTVVGVPARPLIPGGAKP